MEFYLKKEEGVVKRMFLANHEVSVELRGKMVDWMIEVMSSYKTSESCFFLAVELLDSYLLKEETIVVQNKDVHLLGITCMFIAAKYEEVSPISIKTFHSRISHNKFTPQQIRH